MKKTKHILIAVIVVIVACLICFFIGRFTTGTANNEKISSVALENKLTEINELATINYHYTNMAEFENSKDFYGMKIPFTTKSFILTYDGEIKAGVDLSQAKIDVKDTVISIKLPEVEILSHEIYEDTVEIFDENTSIFNSFKVTDYKNFSKDQKKIMEKKAKEKGLLEEAHETAIKSVTNMISGLVPEEYIIKVE